MMVVEKNAQKHITVISLSKSKIRLHVQEV